MFELLKELKKDAENTDKRSIGLISVTVGIISLLMCTIKDTLNK